MAHFAALVGSCRVWLCRPHTILQTLRLRFFKIYELLCCVIQDKKYSSEIALSRPFPNRSNSAQIAPGQCRACSDLLVQLVGEVGDQVS